MMNKQQYIWVGSHNVMNLMNNSCRLLYVIIWAASHSTVYTPSSVIMDQTADGGVVSLLDCVLLSRIKARNSLWFYFWSHDTAFIYTASAAYPTINNGNVKKKIPFLSVNPVQCTNAVMLHWSHVY